MIRLFAIILLSVFLIAWMNPAADKTKEGNRLYKDELFDDATAQYTEVLIDLPNSPHLQMNIGNSAFKKENYEEAIKSYTSAVSLAEDQMMEGRAYYNIGNCKYRQGKLKENTNLQETVSLYREALDYYKQALDRSSDDENAKYNHEFVERKIKELLDAQKQEGQQQEQQQGEGEQQEQQEQQEGQGQQQEQQQQQEGEMGEQQEGQQGDQQEQQGQQGKSGEDGENESEEKTGGETSEQDENDQDQQQQQSGKKKRLTAKEAKMLLDSLKDEELHKPDNADIQRQNARVSKDW